MKPIAPFNTSPHTARTHQTVEERKAHDSATQLESFLVKQLLSTSGAFKGNSSIAGSTLTSDMFADTLASSIAAAGGLGLTPLIEHALHDRDASSQPRAMPTPSATPGLTSAFGQRIDPISGEHSTHTGIDIGAAEGTPIPVAKDGVVVHAGPRGGYGNAVEVRHPDGTSTLYAHASEVIVTPGMQVREGETLGFVGQTGRTTGPHLHLEVRKAGHFLNPQTALKTYRLRAENVGGGEP